MALSKVVHTVIPALKQGGWMATPAQSKFEVRLGYMRSYF